MRPETGRQLSRCLISAGVFYLNHFKKLANVPVCIEDDFPRAAVPPGRSVWGAILLRAPLALERLSKTGSSKKVLVSNGDDPQAVPSIKGDQ